MTCMKEKGQEKQIMGLKGSKNHYYCLMSLNIMHVIGKPKQTKNTNT